MGTTSSLGKQKGKAAAAETVQGLLKETSADPAGVELPELTAPRVEGERVQNGQLQHLVWEDIDDLPPLELKA